FCVKGGLTYENGEKLEIECDWICTCRNGKMDCEDRCKGPFFRRGKKIEDPLCSAKETEDRCCSVMVCAGDTETEPLEICSYNNKTYNRGDTFHLNCSEVCTCEIAGKVTCKPRCPPTQKTSESCVEIPDPSDPCCKKVLCDVTLDDHQDHEKDEIREKDHHKVMDATQLNSSVILLEIEPKFEEESNLPVIEVSNDKENWDYYQLFPDGKLFVKEDYKYLRLENTDDIVVVKRSTENNLDTTTKHEDLTTEKMKTSSVADMLKPCSYKGKTYNNGDTYNDNCESLCMCSDGEMHCLKLECPTYFGVDVLDPGCIEWETVPPNFQASAPHCCPEQIRCKNNGSCLHEDKMYKNWEQLPINVTGCEKRCYCEMGNVECQNTCPPVTALPPPNLQCSPEHASLQHIPDDDCCKYWVCPDPKDQATTTVLPDTKQTEKTTKTDTQTPANTDNAPSKFLGPLSVYENQENVSINTVDVHENPFFKFHEKTKKPSPVMTEIPVRPEEPPQIPHEGFVDNSQQGQFVVNDPDLLHFLQEHPEISHLPHGSVVEIHNVPPKVPQYRPPYFNINGLPGPQYTHPVPPDVSLEEILQELHKNIHQQSVSIPPHQNGYDMDISDTKHLNKTTPVIQSDTFNNHYPDDYGLNQAQDDITVHSLEAVDPHTVRLAFMVPPVIVGLHGRVEVRYTYKDSEDVSTWELQVFAPPNDLIATPSLEFDLLDLVPDKEYKIKITITLRDLHNTPSSRVYKIKTPKEIQTTLPPQIPIEPDLEISDINSTWVTIVWRRFTDYELQFIDGVQLRYRENDGKIYTATPLIHRAVTQYTLENLKPNTKYEIGIFFIPFSGQHTELTAEHMVHFTTANEVDTYGFTVSLEISQIKSTNVEISWSGVPYPEDKYVNIYRAIYQSDSGKEDHSTFKIAKRDSPTKAVITDLKPGTRYRLWLEVYLTNGKIKTSNVQDLVTKPRAAPSLTPSPEKESRSELIDTARSDYYGPLVIVAILAAIAILSTLILLLILMRRHNQNKAAITPPSARITQAAYDNPTYKVEIQQETMGL
ncbi:hypothetical protein GWI33_017167, partial [Rhynchophorus ferrugineus]